MLDSALIRRVCTQEFGDLPPAALRIDHFLPQSNPGAGIVSSAGAQFETDPVRLRLVSAAEVRSKKYLITNAGEISCSLAKTK